MADPGFCKEAEQGRGGGTKPNGPTVEALKAKIDGFLGKWGGIRPCSPARGSGERCNLPSRDRYTEPLPPESFLALNIVSSAQVLCSRIENCSKALNAPLCSMVHPCSQKSASVLSIFTPKFSESFNVFGPAFFSCILVDPPPV